MATPKWFDAQIYMQNKLAQMQATDPDYSWDELYDAFRDAGFVGEEGQYEHFVKFGADEEVAPNAYFDADEYYAAKAKQYYEEELKQEFTGSEEQIANVKNLIKTAGMNAWTHYQQFGSAEGVNPSNAFDASDYCAAKAEAMNNAGQKAPDGTDWTAEKIAKAIDDAGMSVLEHYLTYAGTGEGEVAAGSTYPVSEDEQVVVSKPGETFTLTAGVDNLVGTAGDDIFSAVNDDADKPVLGAFDSIDGGAGNDTLNITDTAAAADAGKFSFPADFSMKSVENVTIATTGAIEIDLSANADVVSIKGDARGEAASTVTASGNTDVALTVAGQAAATVDGGKAVSVTAGTGTTKVTGDSLTSVTIKGGATATISNDKDADDDGKGTTLTSVVLDGVDGTTTIKADGLTDVTVKGATENANTVTITNSTEEHSLTVHVDGTGYKADGKSEVQTVIKDASATSMTVEASGEKSNLALTGSTKLENLTITGDAALTLKAEDLAALKAINGSAANGALILGDLHKATVDVQTGSGNDSFTINATDKVTVDAGAGNDVVTLGAVIAAGSSIDLGAGDDTLLSASGSVAASTKDATTVIDGGDGFDSVSASLINAGNAAQFHNFEALDITAKVTGFDFDLLTNSAIEALTLSGSNSKATINNVAAGVDLRVSGNNTAMTTINVKDAASGDADAFSVTLNETADAAATAQLTVNGIENLTVEATGAGDGDNTLQVTDDALQSLTITGSQKLTLSFSASGSAGDGVSLIDGSAATGDLTIKTNGVTADSKLGLTVKTGSGADSITLAGKATVDAGAGDDTITSSAQGGTFTGGDGKDTFNVAAAKGSDNMVTITDFVAGTDKLAFADKGTETFDKAIVSGAQSLEDALNAAAAGDGSVNGALSWFQYGGDTYIVQDLSTDATFQRGDIVVKLVGEHDLSDMTVADFNFAS